MAREDRFSEELTDCICGFCNLKIRKYDKYTGKERRYAQHHQNLGRRHSEERNKKIAESVKEERSGLWKGDDIGYHGLHKWVKSRLPKTTLCEICRLIPPRELANLTGIYSRELRNWGWMCRKCHVKYDNLTERAQITKRNNRNKNNLLTEFF